MKQKHPQDSEDHYLPKHWIGCPTEAEFFGEERKEGKKQRKIASAKDRSKYKKTDRDKLLYSQELIKNQEIGGESLEGRVLSISSEGVLVDHKGNLVNCKLRGTLKQEKGQAKNLITVGDLVLFEGSTPGEGSIVQILPRRTVLSRADNLSRRREQLIAANIDQVLITVSVVSPVLRPSIIDRYIIAAKKGGMEPVIVINKIDLLDDETLDPEVNEVYTESIKAYRELGIVVIPISIITKAGLEELKEQMKDRTSVFSGQSGVGKSSLINAITGSDIRVGHVVDRTQKGSHTTTKANLVPLEFGGWCIDTPGIRSFGIWDLQINELERYFSEIHEEGERCRFPDCSHIHEEGCAVQKAVEEGKISLLRYESYVNLIENINQEHFRR